MSVDTYCDYIPLRAKQIDIHIYSVAYIDIGMAMTPSSEPMTHVLLTLYKTIGYRRPHDMHRTFRYRCSGLSSSTPALLS